MKHARQDKDISDFNSFEVFEEIYNKNNSGNFNQLEMPEYHPNRRPFFYWFALFLFIIVLGLSIHPLLSYTLKTPYPLIVVGQDSMQPTFKKSGLIVVSGVIDKQTIQANDVILYKPSYDDQTLSIERVISSQNNQIIVRADLPDSPSFQISSYQVVGKVISQRSIYLPLLNQISTLLAQR